MHEFQIEKGRHKRPVKVPRDAGIRDWCLEIEDEFSLYFELSKV